MHRCTAACRHLRATQHPVNSLDIRHNGKVQCKNGTWMKARFTCGCSAAATLLVAPHARLPRWLAGWLLGPARFCMFEFRVKTAVQDMQKGCDGRWLHGALRFCGQEFRVQAALQDTQEG